MDKITETYIDKYLNRQDVMYRVTPKENIDTFWSKLTAARREYAVETPLQDKEGQLFWFAFTPNLAKKVDYIDEVGKHDLFTSAQEDLAESIIMDAILDEAFYSSVIEGAFSTKQRTAEMIAANSKPVNKSEQMIFNNYNALHFVMENIEKPLDEEMILSIYRIVTRDTLGSDDKVEKYRTGPVYVWDSALNKAIYDAPTHTKVQVMMNDLIAFINNDVDGLHPVIKACIIHVYFVYIHPFFDGNGRTARAISYMYLLQRGYGFFKFFSISSIIREQKNKYYKAIKDTEDYGSDLTYFILYYADMIIDSINTVIERFRKEFSRRVIKDCLNKMGIVLSKRQSKAVNALAKGGKNFITIEEYTKKYKVVYETGRTDLNQLVKLGILIKTKVGKKYIYKLIKPETLHHRCNSLDTGD